MSLRSKTKRRLLFLGGLFIAALVALFVWRSNRAARETQRLAQVREAGMLAYAHGDYQQALPLLRQYLAAHKTDQQSQQPAVMDALYALADAQLHIVPLEEKQYAEAVQYLDEYVNARPKDEKGLRLQMDVRTREKNWPDVISIADLLLQIHPDDKDILWQKAEAQIQPPKPNYTAARTTIEKLLTVAPRHIEALNRLAALKLKSGVPTAQVVADAEKLLADHPSDAGYESAAAHGLIYAASVDEANRAAWVARARAILNAAIARPPTDAPTVFSLVTGLDETLRFKDAIDYLTRVAETQPDPAIELMLVQRLWESDQFQRVIDRAAKSPSGSPTTHVDILAFQVMSLRALAADPKQAESRTRLLNQSDEIAAVLAKRTNDVAARQWAALLKLEAENSTAAPSATAAGPATAPSSPTVLAAPPPLQNLVKQYREISRMNPQNAVAHARLGDAWLAIEEDELAVTQWVEAANLQREWAYPHAQIAALKMRLSSPADSSRTAEQARMRAPDSRSVQALWLMARYRVLNAIPEPKNVPASQPAYLVKLLEEFEAFNKAFGPDEALVPLHVSLLAKVRGKEPAVQAIDAALAARPPAKLQTLVQLLNLDESQQLGAAERIIKAIAAEEAGPGVLAVRRGTVLLEQGKPQAGLQEIRAAQKQANGESDRQWMLTVAMFQDRAGFPEAPVAVAALANRFPQDVGVQLQVLRTSSVHLDRDLWEKTIGRLQQLTGDEATRWRMEKANWLLSGPATATSRKEAINLIRQILNATPDSFDAYRLLGRALREDGQYDRAVAALQQASSLRPGHIATIIEAAGVLAQARKIPEATAQLALVAGQDLRPEDRLSVATLYEQLGRSDRAIESLQRLPEGATRDARLARLYRAGGKNSEAEAAFLRLLDETGAQPGDLLSAADFFAATGRQDVADKFLKRLSSGGVSPAMTEVFLAQYQERHGAADQARAHLTKATELDPRSELAWRSLAGFRLRTGDAAGAAQAIEAAQAAVGKTPDILALQSIIATVRKMPHPERLGGLIGYLSVDPTQDAARATLEMLASGQAAEATAGKDPAALALARQQLQDRLAGLAREHAGFWPLQELVIRQHLRTNMARAAELAWAATPNFIGKPEPAQLATEAFAALRRWSRVTEAATVWRQRSGADTVPADIFLAEAQIGQKQPNNALRILQPLIQANPLSSPGQPATRTSGGTALQPATLLELYRTYGRALVAAGRAAEAQEQLKALLEMDVAGREAWMAVASAAPDAETARRWLDRVAPLVPETAAARERIMLAAAWQEAARAVGDAELLKPAATILNPLATTDPPSLEAARLAGLVAHYLGDYHKAEECWRAIHRAAPADVEAINNLAYVLLVRANPDNLPEATKLSERAVAAAPEPAFLGTLARARSRNGDRAGAIAAYRQALAKDAASGVDENVESRLGLAQELSHGKPEEREEAKHLLVEIRRLVEANKLQPPEIRQELAAVEAALK